MATASTPVFPISLAACMLSLPLRSPLVFDLALQVVTSGANSSSADDSGWRILHVYGSPNPNETALSSDGTIMRVRMGR